MNNPINTIKGLTPEGYKEYKISDFIKGYLEDDQLYINYLLLAKRIINKEKNVKWSI